MQICLHMQPSVIGEYVTVPIGNLLVGSCTEQSSSVVLPTFFSRTGVQVHFPQWPALDTVRHGQHSARDSAVLWRNVRSIYRCRWGCP